MQAIADSKEAVGDIPDGLNAVEGVRYLAESRGFPKGEELPDMLMFSRGFSEKTAFVKSSNGRGYYRTTATTCTCPSFKYRGGLCKHQKAFIAEVDRREFEAAYKTYQKAKATYQPEPLPDLAMEERRQRIAARNAKLREEREARETRPVETVKGFNQPEEART